MYSKLFVFFLQFIERNGSKVERGLPVDLWPVWHRAGILWGKIWCICHLPRWPTSARTQTYRINVRNDSFKIYLYTVCKWQCTLITDFYTPIWKLMSYTMLISVHPSVHLPVCPSKFSRLLSNARWDVNLKLGIWLVTWHIDFEFHCKWVILTYFAAKVGEIHYFTFFTLNQYTSFKSDA